MSPDQIASILWRRRLTFLVSFAAGLAAVIVVTFTLPKQYAASSTLVVGAVSGQEGFFDTSLAEQLSRTYSTLAANPNVAEEVADELPLALTRTELLERMSFAPVERTRLLLIRAEAPTAGEAQLIANTYAEIFTERVDELVRAGEIQAPVAVAEPAVAPTRPAKPSVPLYVGLGALLSLLGALAVALLRERLDTRIRVAPEEDMVFGQPILARIPRIVSSDGAVQRQIGDHFVLLKTNLDFIREAPAGVVVITSPGTGEGKTTLAAHLAAACASDGEKVVLLEGDLRRPSLEETIMAHVSPRSRREKGSRPDLAPVGLANYLAGAAALGEIVREDANVPGLQVIRAGLIPPNPSVLLQSPRLKTLLDILRTDYDRVIVDTCPISVGADASLLASRADGTVYVLDQRKANRSQAQAGLNQLAKVHATVLGVVFNSTERPSVDGYYYAPRGDDDVNALAGPLERSPSRARI